MALTVPEVIKKNRDMLLIAGAGVVIVVVIIVMLTQRNQSTPEDRYYDVPLETDSEEALGTVSIDTTLDPRLNDAVVYSAKRMASDQVEEIVARLGFSGIEPVASASGRYRTWERGDAFAQYSEDTSDLVVNSEPIVLSEIERGYVAADDVEDYFRQFVHDYLGIDAQFDIETEETSNGFVVRATQLLEGFAIVRKPGEASTITAVFTAGGDLTALSASLFTFIQTTDTVKLVTMQQLRSFLLQSAYPKEEYIQVVPNQDGCTECDPYGMYSPDQIGVVTVTDIQVVYYFDPQQSKTVLPVYRLSGTAVATDEDGVVPVTVVIYANAIDPSRIVIPDSQ